MKHSNTMKAVDRNTFNRAFPDPKKPFVSAHCLAGTCKFCSSLKCTHGCRYHTQTPGGNREQPK